MKKYSVGMVRERLSEALDEAQRGEPVFIHRHGVEYRLSVVPAKRRRQTSRPKVDVIDPAIADGQWTWDWSGDDLQFRARPRT